MSDVVDAHLTWMKGERYSPVTIRDRARELDRADRALPRGLCDVTPDEITSYIYSLAQWSDWTRSTYFSHLRGFYAWAAETGWFTYDPTSQLRAPRQGQFLPKPLTVEELRRALAESAEPWFTCILLGVGAGLRRGEMADLLREDVTEQYLVVRHGKGGKARVVDTCATLWCHVRDLPPGPLVRNPRTGAGVTAEWLSATGYYHWRSIGLPQVHLHRLRHSFASHMFDDGNDPLVIRDLMGHASVATTQGYTLVSGRKRRKAVSDIDALLSSLLGTPAGL